MKHMLYGFFSRLFADCVLMGAFTVAVRPEWGLDKMQSSLRAKRGNPDYGATGLLRRFAPRNDGG
jgi:hypothetical protein